MGIDFADAGRREDYTANEMLIKNLVELRGEIEGAADKNLIRRAIKRIESLEKTLRDISQTAIKATE